MLRRQLHSGNCRAAERRFLAPTLLTQSHATACCGLHWVRAYGFGASYLRGDSARSYASCAGKAYDTPGQTRLSGQNDKRPLSARSGGMAASCQAHCATSMGHLVVDRESERVSSARLNIRGGIGDRRDESHHPRCEITPSTPHLNGLRGGDPALPRPQRQARL